jgi:hypothetical protein
VDLDALDLSHLLEMAEALLEKLEDYQRHAAAAGFRVTMPAVLAWQASGSAAPGVEAELSRLGLPASLPVASGAYKHLLAVDGLREWLLAMRGRDGQGWGVRGWELPTEFPIWQLPELACPLDQLREIVRDLRGIVLSEQCRDQWAEMRLKLLAAIKDRGQNTRPETILKEAHVGRNRGLACLRELAKEGHYNGFKRSPRSSGKTRR